MNHKSCSIMEKIEFFVTFLLQILFNFQGFDPRLYGKSINN